MTDERVAVPGYEFLEGLTPEEDAFRHEISEWLEANLVGRYRELIDVGGPADDTAWDERVAWEKELATAGWRGLALPVEYGGRGLPLRNQLIFAREYAVSGAPYRPSSASEDMFAPTVMLYGTEEQKRRIIPPILSSDCYWAQGFSEPDAGSDLASVKTRAHLDGDEWVVDGQKVWTTFAHHCDWNYVLCRTEPDAPKHKGLSMLLLPLDQPAVESRPIRTMAGNADFCEVFYSGARTPADFILGERGEGWKVAMAMLGIERGTSLFSYQMMFDRELEMVFDLARFNGSVRDAVTRQELARAWIGLRLIGLFNQRALETLVREGTIGTESSIGKLMASTWHKHLGELYADLAGAPSMFVDDGYELPAGQKLFLLSRAETIYGGSQEIQRNLVAERILGLPR